MIKVGKIWSWLAARGKGSGSSRRDGPLYKGLPPTPVPKARSKAGHSIVIISASGNTRQIDLTPFRLRTGVLALVALIALVVLSAFSLRPLFRGTDSSATSDSELAEKVEALKEELKQKDLALSVQERRLKEIRETPTLAAIGQQSPAETNRPAPKVEQSSESEGPLMSFRESSKPERGGRPADDGDDGDIALGHGDARSRVAARTEGPEPVERPSPQGPRTIAKPPVISFDAQDVSAIPQTPNTGTLSFRLVKDSPDIRFSGYLFVFVEMADQRGETAIYAYPQQTRLGEGDLPADYRDGETLSFKYNQRVELPYGDTTRPGASLARVSILLYSENGNVVFQRGFDRTEVKMAHSKRAVGQQDRPRQGAEKRRAL